MKISKFRIKNYRSIKDSGEVNVTDSLFVLAGQNESGKSSVLEALNAFEAEESEKESLNFELENEGDLIQEIAITYTELDKEFYDGALEEILDLTRSVNASSINQDPNAIINTDIFRKIKQFTITKTFDFSKEELEVTSQLDNTTTNIIAGSIHKSDVESPDITGTIVRQKKPYLDVEVYASEIANAIWINTLTIILFNDFQNMLPDKFLLDDLQNKEAEGIETVKNINKLLKLPYEKIALKSTPHKNSTIQKESEMLSASFQQDWQQKIYGNNKVNIRFFLENNEVGKKEISFFVETKDNEFLAPRRRSQGMIWFLSLWLELKARENSPHMLLLFDEPGLYLHIKAHRDMLSVFQKLVKKGHQVIYSTHSPSLIETDKLHNIGLVLNNEKVGTCIEGLTTSKINTENKRDALQPIAEAMGLEPLKDFSVLKKKNVLLEGLSDFWYFNGMRKLLKPNADYEFIPGIGIKDNKINHLISFCIGYGLQWLLIIDNGILPRQLRNDLKDSLFFGDESETNEKIKILSVDEIENLFQPEDLLLIDGTIKVDKNKKAIEMIGQKRKILFSKMFSQKVMNEEIKKADLQAKTIEQFEEVFMWIDIQFRKK